MKFEMVLVVATVAVGIWFVLSIQIGTKNLKLESLPHLVKTLIVGMENNASLSIRPRSADSEACFVRVSGSNKRANVEFRIIREGLTDESRESIVENFKAQGFHPHIDSSPSTYFCRVNLKISNIWEDAVGASGTHLVRIYLEAIGVTQRDRFDVRMTGRASTRIREHKIAN